MNDLTIHPKEETASAWLQRVQRNKRKLTLHPIAFFPKQQSDESDDRSLSSRLFVTDRNLISAFSQTFQCQMSRWNELHCRTQRWRRRRRKPSKITNTENLRSLEDLLLESFPKGTGISFIDKILSTTKINASCSAEVNVTNAQKSNKGVALEIVGRTGTGKTKILMALAANYAAATSTSCMRLALHAQQPLSQLNSLERKPIMPLIMIFDPEYAIDFEVLAGLVRVALLRRWNATSEFRQCLKKVTQRQSNSVENEESYDYGDIENDIKCALARIHILRPKDIVNGYVSALESISQALDGQISADQKIYGVHKDVSTPPAMLLFDLALSAFQLTNKMQESLPNGNGLSGINDFLRQLRRLQSKHNIIMVSTRAIMGSNVMTSSYRYNYEWNNTSHRLLVMKSAAGSPEERDGWDFVAILKPQNNWRGDSNVDQGLQQICPFSFTSNGISCRGNI